jgi:hypothetical protein
MSQAKIAMDEMTLRIQLIYEQLVLYNECVKESGLDGFNEDDLSLIRWAFGIKEQ